jgi:hypothetical protein
MTDSIIEELYAIKEAIAREDDYDSERMSASSRQCVVNLERMGYKFKYLPLRFSRAKRPKPRATAKTPEKGSASRKSRLRLSKTAVRPRKKREAVLV